MFEQPDFYLVPQQFATVQAAVDAVTRPATIIVQPGLYRECVRVIAKQSVVIQSARLSRRGVTVTGTDGPAAIHSVDSELHLSGIAVRTDAQSRGILVEGGLVNLHECLVAGNRVSDLGAGMLCRGARVRLQKSAILANVIHGDGAAYGAGVYLEDCDAEIAGSTIQGNAAYASHDARGGGLYLRGVKLRMWRSRVTDNFLVSANGRGGGVYVTDPRRCDFGGSVVTGNDCPGGAGGGIFIADGAANVHVHHNTFVRQNNPTDVER